MRPESDGPPPPHRWEERDPAAAARLAAARLTLTELAEHHRVPLQNLLAPELVRRLCWEPPRPTDVASLAVALAEGGARRWQVELTAGPLAAALAA